ncbi:MAG: efflux RND transporter periplasmic adaptor subunit, partial [Ignavibacteria bacterium]
MYKLLIILTIAFLFIFSSCGQKSETKTNDVKKLPLVKVQEVTGSKFTENFKVVGTVKPFASAKLSSEEGGLIVYISKNKGDRVSSGETVVRLKKDVEDATYQQSLAQYELAKVNFQKQEQMYNENATTEMQYLTAKWQLEAAEKSLDVLKTHLSKGFVKSPISGVVEEKYMNKGEMTAPGVPILSIVDVSRVKISAGVPEKYVNEVKKGQSVRITVDVLPGVEFDGKVNYLAPVLSSVNRTFEIEIVIDNKDRVLKPEMNANVEIAKFEVDNAVVISQDMII